MFHRNRENAERRRVEHQTKVYNQLMAKPYLRRIAEKSRCKTLEQRAVSVETWAMASGMLIAGFLVSENLESFTNPHLALACIIFSGIGSVVSTVRYVIVATVLAFDLRALEQRPNAHTTAAAVADDVVAA